MIASSSSQQQQQPTTIIKTRRHGLLKTQEQGQEQHRKTYAVGNSKSNQKKSASRKRTFDKICESETKEDDFDSQQKSATNILPSPSSSVSSSFIADDHLISNPMSASQQTRDAENKHHFYQYHSVVVLENKEQEEEEDCDSIQKEPAMKKFKYFKKNHQRWKYNLVGCGFLIHKTLPPPPHSDHGENSGCECVSDSVCDEKMAKPLSKITTTTVPLELCYVRKKPRPCPFQNAFIAMYQPIEVCESFCPLFAEHCMYDKTAKQTQRYATQIQLNAVANKQYFSLSENEVVSAELVSVRNHKNDAYFEVCCCVFFLYCLRLF
jgi:hypothetical protein